MRCQCMNQMKLQNLHKYAIIEIRYPNGYNQYSPKIY